jgi:hypothetical protein
MVDDKLAFLLIRHLKFRQRVLPVKRLILLEKTIYMVAGSTNFINELLKLNL